MRKITWTSRRKAAWSLFIGCAVGLPASKGAHLAWVTAMVWCAVGAIYAFALIEAFVSRGSPRLISLWFLVTSAVFGLASSLTGAVWALLPLLPVAVLLLGLLLWSYQRRLSRA